MIDRNPKYPVEMPMNPAIMKSLDGTETYAVGGAAPWVLIPNGTTHDNLHLYAYGKKWEVKKAIKKFGVTSTNGKKQYIVQLWQDNKITCDCSGFKWRAKCKHEKAVKMLKRKESTLQPSQAVV